MRCYDPDEQVFNLGDKVIGIDWGKGGDAAVQVTIQKIDGTNQYRIVELKTLREALGNDE